MLGAIHANPHANNRQIAELAGITDVGQTSKLLARLASEDLIVNANTHARQKGEGNSWTLTAKGAAIARAGGLQHPDIPIWAPAET